MGAPWEGKGIGAQTLCYCWPCRNAPAVWVVYPGSRRPAQAVCRKCVRGWTIVGDFTPAPPAPGGGDAGEGGG